MTLMTDAGRVNHQDLRSRQVVNAVPRDDIEYSTVLGRTSESGGESCCPASLDKPGSQAVVFGYKRDVKCMTHDAKLTCDLRTYGTQRQCRLPHLAKPGPCGSIQLPPPAVSMYEEV